MLTNSLSRKPYLLSTKKLIKGNSLRVIKFSLPINQADLVYSLTSRYLIKMARVISFASDRLQRIHTSCHLM